MSVNESDRIALERDPYVRAMVHKMIRIGLAEVVNGEVVPTAALAEHEGRIIPDDEDYEAVEERS